MRTSEFNHCVAAFYLAHAAWAVLESQARHLPSHLMLSLLGQNVCLCEKVAPLLLAIL